MTEEQIIGITSFLVSWGFICLFPAFQARRRGYSLFAWLTAGLLALNPLLVILMLAIAPNYARKRMRRKFLAELDAKLEGRPALAVEQAAAVVPAHSLGDMPTRGPDDEQRGLLRSLGDMPTRMPPERSIGDDETRM